MQNAVSSDQKFNRWQALLLLAPIFIYFFYLFLFSVNIPQNDDFDTLSLSFRILQGDWSALWQQFGGGQYRLVLQKILPILVYFLNGNKFDLVLTIFFGNLSLLAIWTCFLAEIPNQKQNLALGLAVTLLLFSTTTWQFMFFMTGGLTHILGTAAAIFAIGLALQSTEKSFYLSLPVLALSVFHSTGILAFLSVLLVLAINRNWRHFLVWAIAGFIFTTINFIGFVNPEPNSWIESLTERPLIACKFFLGFLAGGIYQVLTRESSRDQLTLIFGFMFVLYSAYLFIVRKLPRTSPFLSATIIYVFGVGLTGALLRSMLGWERGPMSGYSLNSLILMAALLIASFKEFPNLFLDSKSKAAMISIPVLFFVASFFSNRAYYVDNWISKYNGLLVNSLIADRWVYRSPELGEDLIRPILNGNAFQMPYALLTPSQQQQRLQYSKSQKTWPGFSHVPLVFSENGAPSQFRFVDAWSLPALKVVAQTLLEFNIPPSATHVTGFFGIEPDQALWGESEGIVLEISLEEDGGRKLIQRLEFIPEKQSPGNFRNFSVELKPAWQNKKVFFEIKNIGTKFQERPVIGNIYFSNENLVTD